MSDYCDLIKIPCYNNFHEVMRCFVKHDDGEFKYQFYNQADKAKLTVKTYILYSQKWPIEPDADIATTIWLHKMSLYIPKNIVHSHALLYVGGGNNRDKEGNDNFSSPKEVLDFSGIAIENEAVVIILENSLNQPLLVNSTYKTEDKIIAFTYEKLLEDPMQNAYLAGHLPMVKAIVKTMDAATEILTQEEIEVTNFMLVGASKRGWAAWLAALEDKRVSAIVPIVIEILNVKENIDHICKSYINGCPIALYDYKAAGFLDSLESDNANALFKIEDPVSYFNLPDYAQQAAIPKYIISAAGDDFFSPDSLKFYIDLLLGENYFRYLPHAMHYFAGNPISDHLNNVQHINKAINNYFYFHLKKIDLPKVSWSFSENKVNVNSSLIPEQVKLWTAYNALERDFRFISAYDKIPTKIAMIMKNASEVICDTCYADVLVGFSCNDEEECNIEANLSE